MTEPSFSDLELDEFEETDTKINPPESTSNCEFDLKRPEPSKNTIIDNIVINQHDIPSM